MVEQKFANGRSRQTYETHPTRHRSVSGIAGVSQAAEIHVATTGKDSSPGSQTAPLRTIQRAVDLAQPGDVVTVHEGVYREHINPPRGGESDAKRIVYQAAPGEKVEIKVRRPSGLGEGSKRHLESDRAQFVFRQLQSVQRSDPRGLVQPKATPASPVAVYLNGQWLVEAARLDDVNCARSERPHRRSPERRIRVPVNIAWLRPGPGSGNVGRIAATSFAAKHGTANALPGGRRLRGLDRERQRAPLRAGRLRAANRAGNALRGLGLHRRDHRTPPGQTGWRNPRRLLGAEHRRVAIVVVVFRENQAHQRNQDTLPGVPKRTTIARQSWIVVCQGRQRKDNHLGTVQGCRPERATGGDQRSPDRVLPRESRAGTTSPFAASRCVMPPLPGLLPRPSRSA